MLQYEVLDEFVANDSESVEDVLRHHSRAVVRHHGVACTPSLALCLLWVCCDVSHERAQMGERWVGPLVSAECSLSHHTISEVQRKLFVL